MPIGGVNTCMVYGVSNCGLLCGSYTWVILRLPLIHGTVHTAGAGGLPAGAAGQLKPGLLHCWYVDHAVVSLPDDHKFPRHKHRAIRRILEEEQQFKQLSQFHPSPAVETQDLLRVHPEDYVKQFAAGTLSSKEMRAIGFPWNESVMSRQFHSVGGTLAACKALLAQPELKITGHLAGVYGTDLYTSLSVVQWSMHQSSFLWGVSCLLWGIRCICIELKQIKDRSPCSGNQKWSMIRKELPACTLSLVCVLCIQGGHTMRLQTTERASAYASLQSAVLK